MSRCIIRVHTSKSTWAMPFVEWKMYYKGFMLILISWGFKFPDENVIYVLMDYFLDCIV